MLEVAPPGVTAGRLAARPPRRPAGRSAARTVGWLACGAALFVVATALCYAASRHFALMNSDNATLVLEGQSMSNGGLVLHGWALALDSFWSSEVPLYALAIELGIRTSELLYLIPACIAALVVLLGMWLARGGTHRASSLTGPVVVFALLALPSPALSFFFLQGSWHVGTALACLAAFALLGTSLRLRVPLAALALALGLLGDLQTLLLGVLPALGVGLFAALRARRLRAGAPFVAAALAAAALALALRAVARALGAFRIVNPNPTASFHEVLANLARLPRREAGLLGIVAMPLHVATGGSIALRLLHLLGAVLVVGGFLAAIAGLLRALVAPRREVRTARPALRALDAMLATDTVDDLLLLGLLGDVVAFVILSGTGNANYGRYLTASVLFGAVLAGRASSRALEAGLPSVSTPRFAGALTALLLLFGAGFWSGFSLPATPNVIAPLQAFLVAHHLRSGVGDYWSSSIVTVESDGAVRVRPVIEDPAGRLVRYGRQTTSAWYAGQRFDFVVFDALHPWRGVGAASTEASFGQPSRIYAVGTYRVLVFSHSFSVGTLGYTRGTPRTASARSPVPSIVSSGVGAEHRAPAPRTFEWSSA